MQEEADEATLEEAAEHGDLIFVPGTQGTDYRSIVYKTFALVQWVARHSQPRFVLKTDDDAYVHTANLVASLQKVLLCHASVCGCSLYCMLRRRTSSLFTLTASSRWKQAMHAGWEQRPW